MSRSFRKVLRANRLKAEGKCPSCGRPDVSDCPPAAGCYVSEPPRFSYVDVIGEGCEGWLNLFFGQQCVALIDNVFLANEIREAIKPKPRINDAKWTEFCVKCGVSVPADFVFPHTCIET